MHKVLRALVNLFVPPDPDWMEEDRIPADDKGRRDLSHYTKPLEYYIALYQASLGKEGSPRLRWKQRVHATWAFLAKGEASAPYLLSLLYHENPDAREDSAYLLGEIGRNAKGLEDSLLNRLTQERDPVSLTAIIETLGKLKSHRAIPLLGQIITTYDDAEILEESLRSLGRITGRRFGGNKGAVNSAIDWLQTNGYLGK